MKRVEIFAHGLKKGPLPKADIYFDARGWKDIGFAPGQAKVVSEVMWNREPEVKQAYREILFHHLNAIPSRRDNREAGRKNEPIRICCFCAFGMHRSVMMRIQLAKMAENMGYQVSEIT